MDSRRRGPGEPAADTPPPADTPADHVAGPCFPAQGVPQLHPRTIPDRYARLTIPGPRVVTSLLAAAGTTALAVGTATLLAASTRAAPYRDGPPPGFSGGFGEQACDACHFPAPVNDPSGSLRIDGLPDRYTAGATYPISIILQRTGMALGGFQLTARYAANGAQAGSLTYGAHEGERLAVAEDRGVQYVYQRDAGSEPGEDDTARWVVDWTAPSTSEGGRVSFNVAANAADGDDTTSGDFVFIAEAGVDPDS